MPPAAAKRGTDSLSPSPLQASIADRLGSTVFLAALAHGIVILGITFTTDPLGVDEYLPSLNVTLVVDADDAETPTDSELLADRSRRGGGNAAEGLRPTAAPSTDQPLTQVGDPFGTDRVDAAAAPQSPVTDQLLARNLSADPSRALPESVEEAARQPMKAAAMLSQTSPPTLALELDERAELPRNDGDAAGPSTRESALAEYLVGWRRRVERIGTANFPERFLTGDDVGRPMVEVAIGPQGHLEDIVVRRSSGDKVLDQAALRILRLAAPFEPLPSSVLADRTELRFAYEWDFSGGGRTLPANGAAN